MVYTQKKKVNFVIHIGKMNHYLRSLYLYIIIILVMGFPLYTFAENHFEINDVKNDSTLVFEFDNLNFFKNAEYFNPIVDGYTDLGLYMSANVIYRLSNKLSLTGGINFLKFSGENSFAEIQPVFSIKLRPSTKFSITMGTLDKTKLCKLSDPLYFEDLHWKDNVENGVQFSLNSNFLKGDLWVDWENYINSSSTDQEQFTLGLSSSYTFLNRSSNLILELPFGFLFNHKGGQINKSDEDLISMLNTTLGVRLGWVFNSEKHDKLIIKYNFLGYSDNSPKKNQLFSSGFGHLTGIEFTSGSVNIYTDYWYGYHYISSKGNPVYMSVSERNEEYVRPIRKLIIPGFIYTRHINNKANLSFEFTSYYDTERLDFDYSFFLSIQINFFKLLN